MRPLIAAFAALTLVTACQPASLANRYTPGLGELMTLQQMRHAKLWLAGEARNWDLAAYETDELEEGFADIVAFHPTHKDAPVAIAELVPSLVKKPLAGLRAASAAKDSTQFAAAFDDLTRACNTCHEATRFGFNKVTRPTGNAFLNQEFSPH